MSPTDWSSLKVVDLRAELSSRGLPTKGVKAELISRLNEADAAAQSAADDKAEADESDVPADVSPKQEAAEAEAVAENLPSAIDIDASANEGDAQMLVDGPAQTEAVTSPEPVAQETHATQLESSGHVGLPTPLPTNDDPLDLNKRKRRSSTPAPSTKRLRQEDIRLAEEQEDIVDFDTGDLTGSPQPAPETGITTTEEVDDKTYQQEDHGSEDTAAIVEMDTTDGELTRDLEVSGQEAYLKRVVIAEHSQESPHAQPQKEDQLRDITGDDAFSKRMAIGRPSEASQQTLEASQDLHGGRHEAPQQRQGELFEVNAEDDGSQIPSKHTPTSALYIRELMRPLRSEMVEEHIIDLVTPHGSERDPSVIEDFYIDQIRTHAFVKLPTISAAKRVRAALHNQVWPNERNRKPLWVDFVPPNQVKDWIDQEESAGRARWEVVYEQDGEDIVVLHREAGSDSSKQFSKPPPTGPAAGPVYPGIEAAPRGPRGRGGWSRLENPNALQTRAHPPLSYVPLSDDIAGRRIENMRSFYAQNPPPNLGKDYHRFTFENTDSFVDRGVEVFVGIRPPHREREHQENIRRQRLGTAGASSATESRRDDYRPPPRSVFADDRTSRYGSDRRFDQRPRNRGYRGDRGPPRFRDDPYRYRPGY